MTKVYPWDANLGGSTSYDPAVKVQRRPLWDGAPSQATEMLPRGSVELSGEIVRRNAPDFDIMVDRMRGGVHLIAVWDYELRAQNRWDLKPALNSSGAEFWRANGATASYAGEAANPPTGPWRSIFAAAVGAHALDATSLSIDGLLADEVIPKGTMLRIGDFRYRAAAAATADGTGAATVTLASGLRAAVADNDPVRAPGDLFVGWFVPPMEVSPADVNGLRTFRFRFREAYEAEILAMSTASPAVGFEWVVP